MMNKLRKTYIVAVSGGPDSMALLDMIKDKDIDLIVAHVNYHQRDTAIRDQRIVEDYCQQYDIKLHIAHYRQVAKGNFQDNAREFRYGFFKSLADRYHTTSILVAHQLEDILETYYIQKERGQVPEVYGLKKRVKLGKYHIIRPLIKYTKRELEEYLGIKGIAYGIDESNFDDKYLRNRIRQRVINTMSEPHKKEVIKGINKLNRELNRKRKKTLKLIQEDNTLYNVDLLNCDDRQMLMRLFLGSEAHNTTAKYIEELCRQLLEATKIELQLKEHFIVKENDMIKLSEIPKDYSYTIEEIKPIKTEYFKLVKNADSFHSATITDTDLPLTIRNYHQGDTIKMNYGTKKISRWFIDNKINVIDRMSWPVILNGKGCIILVPKIGCDFAHYSNNPNLFVIK